MVRERKLVPPAVSVYELLLIAGSSLGLGFLSSRALNRDLPVIFRGLFEVGPLVGHAIFLGALWLLFREWIRNHSWIRDFNGLVHDQKKLPDGHRILVACDNCHGDSNSSLEQFRSILGQKVSVAVDDINTRWIWYYSLALAALIPATLAFFVNLPLVDSASKTAIPAWKELAIPLAVATAEMLMIWLVAAFVQTRWVAALLGSHLDLAKYYFEHRVPVGHDDRDEVFGTKFNGNTQPTIEAKARSQRDEQDAGTPPEVQPKPDLVIPIPKPTKEFETDEHQTKRSDVKSTIAYSDQPETGPQPEPRPVVRVTPRKFEDEDDGNS